MSNVNYGSEVTYSKGTLIEAGIKKTTNYLALKEKHLWGRGAVEEKAVSEFDLVERGAGQGRRERERRGEERRGPHWRLWVAKKVTVHAWCLFQTAWDCQLREWMSGVRCWGACVCSACVSSVSLHHAQHLLGSAHITITHHDSMQKQSAIVRCVYLVTSLY